jgi:hypothetical protein
VNVEPKLICWTADDMGSIAQLRYPWRGYVIRYRVPPGRAGHIINGRVTEIAFAEYWSVSLEEDLRQSQTVLEYTIAKARDAGRNRNAFQVRADLESPIFNGRDTIRDIDRSQMVAVTESRTAYIRNAAADIYICQSRATRKSIRFDPRDAPGDTVVCDSARNCNKRRLILIKQSSTRTAIDGISRVNNDTRKISAMVECSASDICYGIGDGNVRQATVLERCVADTQNAFRYRHTTQTETLFECFASNADDARRNRKILEVGESKCAISNPGDITAKRNVC